MPFYVQARERLGERLDLVAVLAECGQKDRPGLAFVGQAVSSHGGEHAGRPELEERRDA
jgi:hypothetical protein